MSWGPSRLLTRILLATLPLAALALPAMAGAQTIAGSGVLVAKDKLVAKGCGRAKLTGPQTVILQDDGSWTAMDDGGDTLGGTYTARGSKGRKFDLTFDAPSLAALRLMLEEDLSDLCETGVVVTTIETKRFVFVLNPRRTKATVKAKFRLLGTTLGGQPGKGSFKVKAKGPWTTGLGSPSGAFLADRRARSCRARMPPPPSAAD